MSCQGLEQLGCLSVTQPMLYQQPPDMWTTAAGLRVWLAAAAPWDSATPEQLEFAVRPQAADADIAALVAATLPAAQISMAIMDIQGYNG